MKLKYIILVAVSALVLVLDQLSKLYIDKSMALHSSISVVEGFFNITYLRNKGAAFGILASSTYRLPFFLLVSTVAVIVILVAVGKMRDDQTLNVASLSLIFSGALGNMIDRIRLGEVIDFLDVQWKGHHWPAFNIADSAICVGVFFLAVDMLLEDRREKRKTPPSEAP